eukprot:1279084-Pyramimonas_sp.AAC.1
MGEHPFDSPKMEERLCCLIQSLDSGRRARAQRRTKVETRAMSLEPPSSLGILTIALTVRSDGQERRPSHLRKSAAKVSNAWLDMCQRSRGCILPCHAT